MNILEDFNCLPDELKTEVLSSISYEIHKAKIFSEKVYVSENDVTWEDFNSNFIECHRCHYWDRDQCICYAR